MNDSYYNQIMSLSISKYRWILRTKFLLAAGLQNRLVGKVRCYLVDRRYCRIGKEADFEPSAFVWQGVQVASTEPIDL